MDPVRLRALRAVVSAGSVTAAARSLGYTASAISQHLSVLQRETGLVLLERDGRGVRPTAAGRALALEADKVLEAIAGAEGVAADLRAGRVGTLSVSYFASAGATLVPAVAAVLSRELPELTMDLRLSDTAAAPPETPADIELYVAAGADDVRDGCEVTRLMDDPFVVVLRGDHPLAARASIPLKELAAESFVDNDPLDGRCRRQAVAACAEAGFTPRFRVESPDYPTALSFVAAGVGITLLPRLALTFLPAGTVAVPVHAPVPSREIKVAVRASVLNHAAARRAVEVLREQSGLLTNAHASAG